jgi:hypothetical protein
VSHKDIVAAAVVVVVTAAAAVLTVVYKGPVCPHVTMKNIQMVIKIFISVVSTAIKFLKTKKCKHSVTVLACILLLLLDSNFWMSKFYSLFYKTYN